MGRVTIFLYGIIAYGIFFITFLYSIGFLAGVVVPKPINAGVTATSPTAIIIDLLLLLLFAIQHSGMARPGFKRWLTSFIPEPAERSTYVLLSSIALIILFWLWRPLPAVVWEFKSSIGQTIIYALFILGWLIVFAGTFMIDHFELFGLRQIWLNLRQRGPSERAAFETILLYRIVRHPLMLGFIIAFWATPYMTAGHLLFAIATTGYILLALQLEERDLITVFGDTYRDYRRRVPMLIPLMRKRS
jgi:protein-S-isoprenylcysteine O-methyltransferase Ste14